MKMKFFGPPKAQLLGAYHPARSADSSRAVLICSPLGQEYIRTHWALRLLANQLSRKGIHAMRFDYRGHGDSFGDIVDVHSIESWKSDLSCAVDHLKQESGVSSVMLLGLRAGAAIAAEVATERSDVHSIAGWEPIANGGDYLDELRQVHAKMIDLWFQKISTVDNQQYEEILGWRFQRSLLDEIQRWEVDWATLTIPQLQIELQSAATPSPAITNRLLKKIQVDDESVWGKLAGLESAWLRPQSAQLVCKTIVDMFERLEKRQMLGSTNQLVPAGVS